MSDRDLRNVLVHDYLGVDLAEVWQVVAGEIPRLKSSVTDIVRAKSWLDEQ